MKVLQFVNGVYQGHVNESNQLNGLGVFYWKNSQIYYGMHSFFFQQIQGCWKQNVMHGRGIVVLPQGGYVYGYFKNNLLDGKFKLVFPNQDTIFGSSSQGLFQGTAIRKFKESYQYIQCQYEKGNMISISCKITKEQFTNMLFVCQQQNRGDSQN